MKIKRFLFFFLFSFLWLSSENIASCFQTPDGNGCFYHVSLREQCLRIRIDCPGIGTESVVIGASPWPCYRNVGKNIFDVEAQSTSGSALKVDRLDLNNWVVFNKGRPFSFHYVVYSSKDSFVGKENGDLYRPTLLKDFVHAWGQCYLLFPQISLPKNFFVDENIFGKAYTSFPQGAPYFPLHILLIAGNVRHYSPLVLEVPVEFCLYGNNWKFTDAEFVSLIGRIMNKPAKEIREYPAKLKMVVLTEGSREISGIRGDDDACTFFPSPADGPIEKNPNVLFYFSKSHFGLNWTFGTTETQAGLGSYYNWFHYGFPTYMGQLALFQEGLITKEAFLKWLNQTIIDYYQNPYALSATVDDVNHNEYASYGWEGTINDLGELYVIKGALIAFLFDTAIQRFSNKEKSIWDYFRLLQSQRKQGKKYNDQIFQQILLELSDPSLKSFYTDCVLGAKDFPFERFAKMLSIQYEKPFLKLFELGFEVEKFKLEIGAKIGRVFPGSAAAKAGFRVGDILEKFEYEKGNPSKEAVVLVSRGEFKQTIRYFPMKTMKVFQFRVN